MPQSNTKNKSSSHSSSSILIKILTIILSTLVIFILLISVLKHIKNSSNSLYNNNNQNSSSIPPKPMDTNTNLYNNSNYTEKTKEINTNELFQVHPKTTIDTNLRKAENLTLDELLEQINTNNLKETEFLNDIFNDEFNKEIENKTNQIYIILNSMVTNILNDNLKEMKKLNLTFFEFLKLKNVKIQFLENINKPFKEFLGHFNELTEKLKSNNNLYLFMNELNNILTGLFNRTIYKSCINFYEKYNTNNKINHESNNITNQKKIKIEELNKTHKEQTKYIIEYIYKTLCQFMSSLSQHNYNNKNVNTKLKNVKFNLTNGITDINKFPKDLFVFDNNTKTNYKETVSLGINKTQENLNKIYKENEVNKNIVYLLNKSQNIINSDTEKKNKIDLNVQKKFKKVKVVTIDLIPKTNKNGINGNETNRKEDENDGK